MSKPIEEILHFENIIATIEAVKRGVPEGIIPDAMFRPTKSFLGNVGYYFKVTSTRQVAQAVMYGSPSKAVKMAGVSKVPVTLLHAYEHFDHDPNLVAVLKSTDDTIQQMGAQEVGRQAGEFTKRFLNLRKAAWYCALSKGKIYLDDEGNLLNSSKGAAIIIDFGVPDGNKNQLNALGKGDIITASWATATTDIPLQIAGIQQASAQLTGYRITTAYYGKNIPSYIAKNTAMKEFLKMNPGSNQAVRRGEIPDGFINLQWREAYSAFYADKSNVAQQLWDDDMVVFTPDDTDSGWWGFLQGSYGVPTNIGQIYGDAMAALNSVRTVFGMFGYAAITHDPVGICQYGGDTMLPVIAVPKAIFIADVTV